MQLTFTTGRVIRGYQHIAHPLSPCGFPKEINALGSEGSLTPYLLMERTLKQYCLPFTRSNTGNLGAFTTMSILANSQLLFPARDWSKYSIRKAKIPFQKHYLFQGHVHYSVSFTCAGGFNLYKSEGLRLPNTPLKSLIIHSNFVPSFTL